MEKAPSKLKKPLFVYVQELKEELKKVSWTSQKELHFSTKMVVFATVFFGLGIYLVDFSIRTVLESLKGILYFIFG